MTDKKQTRKDKQLGLRITSLQRQAIETLAIELHLDLTELVLSALVGFYKRLGNGEQLAFSTICKDPVIWERVIQHAAERSQIERRKFRERIDICWDDEQEDSEN